MKKALFVGINYYDTAYRLNGCINDVVNLKNLFVSQMGYTASNIMTLRDDIPFPPMQPTRENILKELSDLVADSVFCSEIWFCYSGHGGQFPDRNRDESDGLDEIIVPADYTTKGFILDDALNKILQKSKCRTILLFDSCSSGSVCDLPWCYEFKNQFQYNRRLENYSSLGKWTNPLVYMISGCKDYQSSSEVYNTATCEFNGQFTAAFIACVNSIIGKNISILILYRNICMLLQQQTSTQLPTLSSSSSVPNMNILNTNYPTVRPRSILKTMKDIMASDKSVNVETRNYSENRDFRKMIFL